MQSDGDLNLLGANRNDDGQWRNAYNDRPDNRWNRYDGFAFAASQLSSSHARAVRRGRVLFCQLSIPAAEHLANLFKREGERGILFRIKQFSFPENHQQHFYRIELTNSEPHPRLFLAPRKKCCRDDFLNCFDTQSIYSSAERVAMCFRERLVVSIPQQICILQSLKNR